ncbi:hypothetical protein BGZ94_002868 [Podila epigama]|nr:hypothetical protein BGZ94_002868 [Podila epigama]
MALAFSLLKPEKDFETYRWPVQQEMLPAIPVSQYVDDDDMGSDEREAKYISRLASIATRETDLQSDLDNDDENMFDENLPLDKEGLEGVQRFFRDEMLGYARQQLVASRSRWENEYAREEEQDAHGDDDDNNVDVDVDVDVDDVDNERDEQEEQEWEEVMDELPVKNQNQANAIVLSTEDTLLSVLDNLSSLTSASRSTGSGVGEVGSESYQTHDWQTVMHAASRAGVDER